MVESTNTNELPKEEEQPVSQPAADVEMTTEEVKPETTEEAKPEGQSISSMVNQGHATQI